MNLYLMRHGIAEPLGEGNQFLDFMRALTPEGHRKLREICKGLKRLGVEFQLLASSPLVRARETAEVVGEVLHFQQPVQLWNELEAGGSLPLLLKKLEASGPLNSILLVGHQPDLGFLASHLVFGSSHVALDFKKGGICCIQISEFPLQVPAELVWMLPPRVLRVISEPGDRKPLIG